MVAVGTKSVKGKSSLERPPDQFRLKAMHHPRLKEADPRNASQEEAEKPRVIHSIKCETSRFGRVWLQSVGFRSFVTFLQFPSKLCFAPMTIHLVYAV